MRAFPWPWPWSWSSFRLDAWRRWATRRGWRWRARWRCPSSSAPPFSSGPLRCRPWEDENSFNHYSSFRYLRWYDIYVDNTFDPFCRMGASFLQRVGAKQRWRIFGQIIIFKKESKLLNIHYTLQLQSNTLDQNSTAFESRTGKQNGESSIRFSQSCL